MRVFSQRFYVYLVILTGLLLHSSHGNDDDDDDDDKLKVPKEQVSEYVVILDAGSTGTRAFAFHYPKRVINAIDRDVVLGKPLTVPIGMFNVARTPGLSNFSRDTDALLDYLQGMCSEIASKLKHHNHHVKLKHVPIYLGATAGMRDLEPSLRHDVFSSIRDALTETGFFFNHPEQARVLSGEEEASFDWLTVNHFHSEDGMIHNTWYNTFGALDMGGESTEISFIPKDPSIMGGLFPMHFGAFPGTVHLYTQSFMHYGQIAAFQRASKALLYSNRQGESDGVLEHPCMPRELRWSVDDPAFGITTSGTAERANGSIDMKGVGNFSDCVEVAKKLIYKAYCAQTPCSFLGVYQPNSTGARFWMTGQFVDLWGQLGLPHEGQPVLEALKAGGTHFCNLSISEQATFVKNNGSGSTADTALLCWLASWSYTMLVDGLGFEPQTESLKVDMRSDVDWPIGAAIYHVNFYPYKVHFGKKHHELVPDDLAELDAVGRLPVSFVTAVAGAMFGALATAFWIYRVLPRRSALQVAFLDR